MPPQTCHPESPWFSRGEGSAFRSCRYQMSARPQRTSFPEDGAGVGDISVKRFNLLAILFFDDAALELERESEAAVIESEIVGKKREAFDGFVLREMGGKALDLAFDERVGARMSGEFGVRGKF